MKIGQKQKLASDGRWGLLAVMLIVFLLGLVVGQESWPQQLPEMLAGALATIRTPSTSTQLPTLIVDMPFTEYDTILGQRNEALETGVYIGGEEDFVPADIRFVDGESDVQVPVRMRLIQGPPNSLGNDEKWGFEVRTRDNASLLDMQRFTLQDPASNNGLNQLAFVKALQREGVLAARYHIVHLVINGDDRGIYAVQEGFGDELLQSQGESAGVIVEFAPERLWESIRHYEGDVSAAVRDPLSNLSAFDFQFFDVDTFRDADIARDEDLSAQKNNAIGLLRGLQAGNLAASEVFDVEKYGTFLALVDLWAATDSVSVANLRYYYDADTGRLQPIEYNGNPLGSDARISPAAFFDDVGLQAAYTRAAERISQDEYLEGLRSEIESELDQIQAGSGLDSNQDQMWNQLQARQAQMRRSLTPAQPVISYLGPPSLTMSATIQIDVANVLNVPVEILGFDIGGATFLEVRPDMIQGDAGDQVIGLNNDRVILRAVDSTEALLHFVRFHLSLIEIQAVDNELDYLREFEILVATRILGQEQIQMTPARPGYSEPIPPA